MDANWHEKDDFWHTTAEYLFSERRWQAVPAELDHVVKLLELEPGAKVLDLCCGVGRHSLELARRGFRVTGVDRTEAYLEQAERRARAEGLDIQFILEDMRTFCRPDAYDAILNLFTSFGYFEDQEDDRRVTANMYRSLVPGGSLLMDLQGEEVLARIFRENNWSEEDGVLFLEERAVSQNWSWIENRWIIIEDGKRKDLYLSHRLYSATELTGLLVSSGFAHAEAFGDLAANPYDHTAKRLVVVARK